MARVLNINGKGVYAFTDNATYDNDNITKHVTIYDANLKKSSIVANVKGYINYIDMSPSGKIYLMIKEKGYCVVEHK
jgi:hypothetical protein